MFDVYYHGKNEKLLERIPFAKDAETIEPMTKMYWLVEPNVEIIDYDIFNYRPDTYDSVYEHVWKWDNSNYGGLRLIPTLESQGIKQINYVACKKTFDIIYTATPEKYFKKNPYSTHVWCVDPEYKLDSNIDWAPSNFEPTFIHSFHLRGQLEHKYPEQEGGIKLYPRDWKSATIKYHTFLDASAKYPVLFVEDPEDYSQRDIYDDEYVWLIDKDHKIDEHTIDWVPNPFEGQYVHSFRMPNQLQEKTWSYKHPVSDRRLGGIRLVPKQWKKSFELIDSGIIIHNDCPVDDESYDVYYIDEDDFTADTYQELAERSKTEWFWVVDREYDFNGKLLFIPQDHELDYIHVFKIPDMLEERYPLDIEEPWDNRCGGVRLVNKNFDMTKHKYQPGIVPVKYDIFYTDDPKQFGTFARKSKTKMFWLIDNEYQLDNNFKIVVPKHEQKFMLNYQLDQLQHKYPEQEGGIYLIPKSANADTQIKYKGKLEKVSVAKYPVVRVSDIDNFGQINGDCWIVDEEYQIEDNIDWAPSVFEKNSMHTFHVGDQLRHKYPDRMGGVRWVPLVWDGNVAIHDEALDIAKQYPIKRVKDVTDLSVVTTDCWLVDEEYQLEDKFTWVPTVFEKESIHTFHFGDQLKHKYPEEMGGIRWVPKEWNNEYIIHESLEGAQKLYPVKFVNNPSDFSQVTEDCWLVDKEYEIVPNITILPWGSWNDKWKADAERKLIHNYHVKGQLAHKYPEAMGGVYWVPKDYANAEVKIHEEPLQVDRTFPVYFVQDPTDFSQVTEDCWLVDKEYEIDPNITILPWGSWNDKWQADAERKLIHVYHVKGQLRHKYPEAMGGIYWVPKDYANAEVKIHSEELALKKTYPMHLVDDPTVITDVSEDCWVLDKDYHINDTIEWSPNVFEKHSIHTFHVGDQLRHKYPEAMGGMRWVPADWDGNYIIHGLDDASMLFTTTLQFEIFDNEEEGIKKSTSDWFWVVDKNVTVLNDFDFSYIPEVWDKAVTHVWQKLNPITNLNYDYSGVKLVNRNNTNAARPKYIREPACIQKEFPVLNLDSITDVIEQIIEFDKTVENSCFWVVDPHVELSPDFEFDYYPTQWDISYLHVFQDDKGNYRNVRLIPKGFITVDTDIEQYAFNSLENIKLMTAVASITTTWPVYKVDKFNKLDFVIAMEKYKDQGIPYVWVVESDIQPIDDVILQGYTPDVKNIEKVHLWQRLNPYTKMVHSYGGLRLWPTDRDYSEITTKEFITGSMKNVFYNKIPGSYFKKYDIVFLSYKDKLADEKFNKLQSVYPNSIHVKDVDGIFEAHKHAASLVSSKMFWVVDCDAELADGFEFDYIPDVYDQETVHVFKSKNPITGDEYGYGGVKLFNTQQVLDATSWGLDFTTGLSKNFKVLDQISNITKFNTDPLSTWRSAFREAAKLTMKSNEESLNRLFKWFEPDHPDAEFAEYAKKGAEAGYNFILDNATKPDMLLRINDFQWLENTFNEQNN